MKRTPIIPIKWINEQHDTDQDGVPNYRDCNPWNPRKHGIIKKFKKRESKQKADAYEALRKHKLGIKKLPPWEVRNLELLAGESDMTASMSETMRYLAPGELHRKKISKSMLQSVNPVLHKDVYNYIIYAALSGVVKFEPVFLKFGKRKTLETVKWMIENEGKQLIVSKGIAVGLMV